MDKNDILKSKKAAIDEMAELAKTGENAERMEELKGEIRSFDSRLEAFDMADAAKKDTKSFVPDIKKENRSIVKLLAGLLLIGHGRACSIRAGNWKSMKDEIRAFRASMVEGVPASGTVFPYLIP